MTDLLENELFLAKARKVFGPDFVDVFLAFYRELRERQPRPQAEPLYIPPIEPIRARPLVEEGRPLTIELEISRLGTGFEVRASAGARSYSEYAESAAAFIRNVHATAFARRIGAAIERASQQLADVLEDVADDYEYRQILEIQDAQVKAAESAKAAPKE